MPSMMICAALLGANGLSDPCLLLFSENRLSLTPEWAAIFVSIAPGKTTVTLTLVFESSECKPSVNSLTAAFAAP